MLQLRTKPKCTATNRTQQSKYEPNPRIQAFSFLLDPQYQHITAKQLRRPADLRQRVARTRWSPTMISAKYAMAIARLFRQLRGDAGGLSGDPSIRMFA
jgi:hypothetical protein